MVPPKGSRPKKAPKKAPKTVTRTTPGSVPNNIPVTDTAPPLTTDLDSSLALGATPSVCEDESETLSPYGYKMPPGERGAYYAPSHNPLNSHFLLPPYQPP